MPTYKDFFLVQSPTREEKRVPLYTPEFVKRVLEQGYASGEDLITLLNSCEVLFGALELKEPGFEARAEAIFTVIALIERGLSERPIKVFYIEDQKEEKAP